MKLGPRDWFNLATDRAFVVETEPRFAPQKTADQ